MSERDGSDLCRDCGICCTGVFFLKVAVTPEEAERVAQAGIEIHREEEKHVFDLPCSAQHDKLCSIYTTRPGICQAYTCKLLDRYLAEEITLEEGQQQTARLVALYEKALSMVSGRDRRFVWKLIHTKLGDAEFREVFKIPEELGATIDGLRAVINREFRRMGEG